MSESESEETLFDRTISRRGFIAAAGAGALALTGVGRLGDAFAAGATIKIGDKGFTEEFIIADMNEMVLNKAGIKTSRHSFSSTTLAQAAITHGDIDLYPEYTGTGLLTVLNMKPIQNEKKVYQTVKREYKKRFNLIWLNESPMNDTNAIAVKMATKQKYNIKTMSDVAANSDKLTFVGLAECVGRADCLVGLKGTYHMNFKNVITTTSPALNYKALEDGRADVSEVFSTDGQIAAYNLYVPIDDKHLWPPYHVAPVVRNDTLKANPKIAQALNKLAPFITTAAISALNAKVDLKKQNHKAVARAFLKQHKLV
jgi:osmoprotectant transport system substrate-binding protein